jgi:hypothetical protein
MRPLLGIAVLAAVLVGGFFYGTLRVITDTGPDW